MKYLTSIFLLLLFWPVILFGQGSSRQYIGLAIGPSIPLSDFASNSLTDSTAGWAKTGVDIQVSYAYRLTHNFGLAAVINYSSNKFNNTAYRDSLNNAHPDTSFSVESVANWSGGGIMIGPFLRFPLSNNLSWDVRGLVGFYSSTSPKATIRATDTNTGETLPTYYRERANALGFGWMVGTGFKYSLSKYYILLFVDYYSSSLSFKNATGWDWEDQPYEISFKQEITYVSVTIGVGYFF